MPRGRAVEATGIAKAIDAAKDQLGKAYVWGAEGPDTFDCSGLMVWAWKKAGVTLPRTSQEQAKAGRGVPISKVEPGDLIISDWGSGPASHVGMYLGGGKLIHAPRPGSTVKIVPFDASYKSHTSHVRRVREGGSLLGDVADAGSSLLGGILAPLGGIADATKDMAASLGAVGDFAKLLTKLALPSTWVRIVSGILGIGLLFAGLYFLIRESRADEGGEAG